MNSTTLLLLLSDFIIIFLMIFISKNVKKNQLALAFKFNLLFMLIWDLSLTFQNIYSEKLAISPIYFDYVAYIGICFLPISFLFTGIIFANSKIKFSYKYLLLLIIPCISLIMLWTNSFHHSFYKVYSLNLNDVKYGPFLILHDLYTYVLFFIGIFLLLKFSIKNMGLFSKQSLLIILGISFPLIINILGTLQIISINIYFTPISFTLTILFCFLAIFKFNFLNATPIALQRVVDRMSDGYLVLNDDEVITDFNNTFLSTFKINSEALRGITLKTFSKSQNLSYSVLEKAIQKTKKSTDTVSFEYTAKKINKVFSIEITSIYSDGSQLGTLILCKDITQHVEDLNTIKNNQETLMEQERLASLGQMIGGISHNLKTPIMSISGAAEGLTDLINEYDASIGDPEVTPEDHHAIANDMREWIKKIHSYTAYMSDVITAVKGQAVNLSTNESDIFILDELLKRVNILMKHELQNASVKLNILSNAPAKTKLRGDINSLVQVINNLITNAIQSYNGEKNKEITLTTSIKEGNLIISVSDTGCGMTKEVQEKLFNSMITTKGKNGTGLGMFMSYSTVKGHFGGDITFTSEVGKGTTFKVILPLKS